MEDQIPKKRRQPPSSTTNQEPYTPRPNYENIQELLGKFGQITLLDIMNELAQADSNVSIQEILKLILSNKSFSQQKPSSKEERKPFQSYNKDYGNRDSRYNDGKKDSRYQDGRRDDYKHQHRDRNYGDNDRFRDNRGPKNRGRSENFSNKNKENQRFDQNQTDWKGNDSFGGGFESKGNQNGDWNNNEKKWGE